MSLIISQSIRFILWPFRATWPIGWEPLLHIHLSNPPYPATTVKFYWLTRHYSVLWMWNEYFFHQLLTSSVDSQMENETRAAVWEVFMLKKGVWWSHLSLSSSTTSDCVKAKRPDCQPGPERHLRMWHNRKPSTCNLLAERGQPGKRREQRILWILQIFTLSTFISCWQINERLHTLGCYSRLGIFVKLTHTELLSINSLFKKWERLTDLIIVFLTVFLGGSHFFLRETGDIQTGDCFTFAFGSEIWLETKCWKALCYRVGEKWFLLLETEVWESNDEELMK